jgi:hypothetical protein
VRVSEPGGCPTYDSTLQVVAWPSQWDLLLLHGLFGRHAFSFRVGSALVGGIGGPGERDTERFAQSRSSCARWKVGGERIEGSTKDEKGGRVDGARGLASRVLVFEK